MSEHICNNCQYTFSGKYCSNCGQDAHVGQLDMHGLLHDAWHGLTHTDKGVLKLIKDLFLYPGATYKAYFAGARKKYFSPIVFFLLSFGLLLLINKWVFDFEDYRFHTDNEFGRYYQQAAKFKALVLLPVQVLITWAFFFRRYNLAQVIVFWLYCIGFVNVLAILLSPFRFAFVGHHGLVESVITWVQYAFLFFHFFTVFTKSRTGKILAVVVLFLLILADVYASYFTINQVGVPISYPNIWQAIKAAFTL